MRFEFEIGDRVRTVEIEHRAGGYLVTVDGRARLVDAARLGERWSLLVREIDGASATSVEVVVTPRNGWSRRHGAAGYDVMVGGSVVPVLRRNGLGRRLGEISRAHGEGPQRVVAPMPGKVTRVLVRPNETVKPRQGLVVVEAMKMENELRAARAGTVREVRVVDGQSVEAGALLLVVE